MDGSMHHDMDMQAMEMGGMGEFGGIPESRDASGTSWQPDETPMHAHHMMMKNDWSVMLHYNAFVGYDRQSGPRGDHQFNSINWLMLMASKTAEDNELTFRTMLSLEPWTATTQGYPLLFQSGESYKGRALVDRQHPHDLFMEVAARYRRVIQQGSVLSFYVAPSGEPALGPTAFPHRMSAMDNPAAPISHHWVDSTHIAFGVVTLGLARKQWQIEGSWFNGREPDEHRWNFDPLKLNSYSGRISWNPTPEWSAQVSGGFLKSPEELHPEENVHRYTASVTRGRKLGQTAHLAATAGWGVNVVSGERSHAIFAEGDYSNGSWNVYGRAEYVQKTGEELDLAPDHAKWDVTQISVGASRELVSGKPFQAALGTSISYTFAPSELRSLYGDHPIGFWIFLRVRPAAMTMNH
ncbi:MAG TPA: hypothetical protein VFT72_17845 [Opitutaceae bacterium]|nr:hypothetical protein [Opitutaceae bacterium]